jgi:hypothetical protein
VYIHIPGDAKFNNRLSGAGKVTDEAIVRTAALAAVETLTALLELPLESLLGTTSRATQEIQLKISEIRDATVAKTMRDSRVWQSS